MTRKPASADEILREMQTAVVPVDSSETVQRRRERTVSRLQGVQEQVRAERAAVRARKRRSVVAAALLVPLFAAGLAFYARHREAPVPAAVHAAAVQPATVRALTGQVKVVHAGRVTTAELGTATPMTAGDGVHTTADARASLTMPSRALVELGPSTNLLVASADRLLTESIELALGRVDLTVPKLEDGKTLAVRTPHATVTVHGTRFAVVVAASQTGTLETTVTVTDGAVLVEHDGHDTELHAGEAWSSGKAPDGSIASDRRSAASEQTVAHEAGQVGPSAPRSTHDSSRSRVAAGDGKTTGTGAASFALATSTLAEENALMERAMVASRNGDDRTAISILDTLLSRFPSSILKENARIERFRALRRMGDVSKASREAQRYLVEHPNGLGTDEARGLAVETTEPRARP